MTWLLKISGSLLALLIMGAVLYGFGGDLAKLDLTSPQTWLQLLAAVGCYVLVLLLGGVGWKLFLISLGHPLSMREAQRQLLLSQLGKYLPGNVLHFAGRGAMAIAAGIPAKIIGAALMFEIATSAAAALATSFTALLLLPDALSVLQGALFKNVALFWLIIGLLLGTIGVVGYGAWIRKRSENKITTLHLQPLVGAFGLYLLSFILLGLSLHLIIGITAPELKPGLGLSIAVFAIAWVVGLVTPGAPGGLGVREALVTLGLTPFIGAPAALTVALTHRAISVLGDVLAFGLGALLPRR